MKIKCYGVSCVAGIGVVNACKGANGISMPKTIN